MAAPKKFAVIGAGVAGLLAAQQLKHEGFDVTIYEKTDNVGGVWQSNYAGYALQVRKWHFVIPGYPWPNDESHPQYPTGQECQRYIERYAADTGLLPLITFNATVVSVSPKLTNGHTLESATGSDGWEVKWSDEKGKERTESYDFVVIATGLFSIPSRPEWAQGLVSATPPASGPWVVDVKDFTDAQLPLAKGKRVVIIGAGKSAHDVGLVTSKVAASTTLVARRGHWMAPQKVLGFLPLEFATYTRWSWALQPAFYNAGAVKRAAHTLFRPVKAAAWALFGAIFKLQTSVPSEISPKHGLLTGIYDTIGMVNSTELSRAFTSGQLAARKARVEKVDGKTLTLSDGSTIEADIVVLATGYQPLAKTLLPTDNLRARAGFVDNRGRGGDNYDLQWLYRNVLPPRLSNIAFIGQHATFAHVLTASLESRWLAGVLSGQVKLPSQEAQLEDIARQQAWWERIYFPRSNNYVWALHGKFHDQLVRDLKGNARAYSALNPVGEWFGYIKNELYSDLFPAHVGIKDRALSGKSTPEAAPAAASKAPNGKAATVAVPPAQVQAAAA
ncbi:flavo involved in K+ transport [Chlorella sorokiniana]|uniref:Flavin-containing monooxygenase n=1 Tax=Chlorella sorokiniana TaxID=3076 RepID=A0A2P6TF04_CHLSO|nr:flavo involved in K+ transport [Chlorella sorokiniana]|eukprot:PRW32555.1 flavo involved in K+ transport [Chlorella sorokiniana]